MVYRLKKMFKGWINSKFTYAICKIKMQATAEKEMEGNQLTAGLSGFAKKQGLFILHQWREY